MIFHDRRRLGAIQRPFAGAGAAWPGPTSGLINQWFLDNSHVSGTTITDSTGGNTGTAHGGVTSTSSPSLAFYSTARAFDGIAGTGITLNANPMLGAWATAAYTLGMWVNVTNISAAGSGGNRPTFFSANNAANTDYMRVLNDQNIVAGAVAFSASGLGSGTTAAQLSNNAWVHIVFTTTANLAAQLIYINAVSQATAGTIAGGSSSSTNEAIIGGLGPAATISGGTPCAIYNVVLYNRVLSGAEVTSLFNAK